MAWTVDIDGNDLTSICQRITWRPKLNRPASLVIRYPGHLYALDMEDADHEMHLYENGTLRFSGPVWFQQPDGSPDNTYTELTAYDHLIYLTKRYCKIPSSHPNGNFITPGEVFTQLGTAPEIMSTYINYSQAIDGLPGSPYTIDSVAGGGVDLSQTPTTFPMKLEDCRSLLCSTGALNILVKPQILFSRLDFTNGGVVNDLTGSVSIQYQTGSYNAMVSSFTEDREDQVAALWYLIGPRGPRMGRRVWIPKNHWSGSITRTAANAGGDGQEPGGVPNQPWPPQLIAHWEQAEDVYGYSQDIRIFDDNNDEEYARPLFEEEYANEAWIRAFPQVFANIKPQRGTAPAFGVGDMISVEAGSRLGGGFSGQQVVFEFEVQIDTEGMVEVTELITSGDQAFS